MERAESLAEPSCFALSHQLLITVVVMLWYSPKRLALGGAASKRSDAVLGIKPTVQRRFVE
jgi:hypothetical protein